MARRKNSAETPPDGVTSYRHDAKRKNIPPSGLAAQGRVSETPKMQFAYDPHLPPVLRSDPTAGADRLPELLESARTRALTDKEARVLADALRNHEPWLEWAGKREKKYFEVDPVALHIHDRYSAQAILKTAAREDVQRDLFADPQQDYSSAVQFYQHDVDWSNRMILGDSLQVMASLARREDLAGKVQMIYMDPPYGIRFKSNFQAEIGKKDVKDTPQDLTREPEMVKAYRDTWELGVHSYLAYMRDRLVLCRELLRDSGSIFVQISDENVHRVRALMDEVFGTPNQVVTIVVKKKGNQKGGTLEPINDYLLWYAKDKAQVRINPIFLTKFDEDALPDDFDRLEFPSGEMRSPIDADFDRLSEHLEQGVELVYSDQLTSGGEFRTQLYRITFEGEHFLPAANNSWKHNEQDMMRVLKAERIMRGKKQIRFRKRLSDFGAVALTNLWTDVAGAKGKIYVVQTNNRVIERCMIMTTDPGDLVLDPTCGGGTTAFVGEQWGRRWITIDTSRVALALARQRILTATFPHFAVQDAETEGTEAVNPDKGFKYRTVPHITLKSIAQNAALDPIFVRHQPILDAKLAALNTALATVDKDIRACLAAKLAAKQKAQGKKAVTDADRRRWLLPKDAWREWEAPFDTDPDWPESLQAALLDYRAAWRSKMDEVNAAIAANAEPEELVDQPEVVKGVTRVSGPFTMEGVMPAEGRLDEESPIGGAPDGLDTFGDGADAPEREEPTNAEAYLDKMLKLLKADGVRFPNNKVIHFNRLDPLASEFLHAEGEWQSEGGDERRVAISVGPQYGPVTAFQVEKALRLANRKGYDDLVFAGFSFDAAAQAAIEEDDNPDVRCHLASIRPDVTMGDLLKTTPNSQIFTVFGSPRAALLEDGDGLFRVEMQGVDVYNPVDGTLLPTSADKVAAWFLDSDYDGRTFCVTQAFFPDKSAWKKIAAALGAKGAMDPERFAALSGTTSLPFPAGKSGRVAVKVIDPRGNEVMKALRFPGAGGGYGA